MNTCPHCGKPIQIEFKPIDPTGANVQTFSILAGAALTAAPGCVPYIPGSMFTVKIP